ncbi:hypothetical protein CWI81_00430 [Idiomarina seosinensis]|uniref:Uncharacterized protein n=1 Tax=Idiomarina seosinensis TaxID=281739 RepID=A0A432ZG83_9GAMM|nr:hypothetical protein CWI81_00430 [Idiomarina seosinensis]
MTVVRPHPAIVGLMVPFLEQLGIGVEQLTQLADLPLKVTAETEAVIISLSVTSPVQISVERVLQMVLYLNPNVRLIFSSELPLQKKQKNLRYLLSRYGRNSSILSVGGTEQSNSCLYIWANDLQDTERRQQLKQLLQCW